MNVPLKKRHNYGKLNGSTSSLNAPSAKRLYSTQSNDDEDSDEYEEESSNADESLQNGPATLGCLTIKDSVKERPFQYLSIEDMAVPGDIPDENDVVKPMSSSSSVILSSSASDHDSSERNPVESSTSSSSDSDSSGSTHSTNDEINSELLGDCEPLTEVALLQHNANTEPMNSKERIQYWNIADEFSEIEDDFDDKKYFSKPIRSERLQKRMYTKPAPVFSSSRKSKKGEKSRKTDDKPSTTTKKPKDTKETNKSPTKPAPPKTPKKNEKTPQNRKTKAKSTRPSPKVSKPNTSTSITTTTTNPVLPVESPIQPSVVERMAGIVVPVMRSQQQPLVSNRIVETRAPSEIPSAIKFRVSYGKDTTPNNFKMPTTPNISRISDGGCANCSKHSRHLEKLNDSISTTSSSELPIMASHNQEEFYKYLGIDTNPPQEKSSPAQSPVDATALYNNRRSLRVFIQQKQNEFTRTTSEKSPRDDKSPDKLSRIKSPYGKSDTQNVHNQKMETPENGKKCDDQSPNGTKKPISSHIKQRHSYEPSSSDGDASRPNNVSYELNNTLPLKNTGIECDAVPMQSNPIEMNVNRFGEGGSGTSKVTRVPKRKIVLPSPMMLTKMFERYKQCFKHGFAMRHGFVSKRPKKRPLNNPSASSTQEQNPEKSIEMNGEQSTEHTQPIITTCEDLINTFSPTSITHSNASTDSAIVVNSNVNDRATQPTITLSTSESVQWQHERIDKTQFPNPLDSKYGAVLAILTHSVSPNNDDVVVVIQQTLISYWYATSKVLGMFGVGRSWMKIGDIPRVDEDIEVNALYQNRLIDIGEPFPIYVEMRAKESGPDEFRQCYLTFVYLNVYFVKPNADGQPEIATERVHLDTVKGYANSIYYTALRTSPSVLMTWTEQNVNNQTRCGTVKFTLKTPTLDNIEEIVDYSYLQHDINSLYAINDYHVVGCGDRTVSMWDHRNGNLLIDIEIELPTIGRNIACYTVGGDDVPDYMLLIQLASNENGGEQLKVMAVQTVDPYNWRTLQTHNIPNYYGKIRSLFNKDDMLTITFISGTMLFLNILSPHKIYIRNVSRPIEQQKSATHVNGINQAKKGSNQSSQFFAQCNGQIIEIANDRVATKSVWEYFIDKD